MGFSDKAVAMFYEKVLHEKTSDIWLSRLQTQIAAVLDRLNTIRAEAKTPWLLGDALSHADIALGCSVRHAIEAHKDAIPWSQWPALVAHSEACEALDVFKAIYQPFKGPGDS
ncbi:MAG: glutathione S-transferase C-terminal domain-containing protein [Asticcacaulis sp.]|nr:glutathione S-transferase C-terminal domain-containing protein [Asticcacaulis sp.]